MTTSNNAPSVTPYTKAKIRSGYIIPKNPGLHKKGQLRTFPHAKLVRCCASKCTNRCQTRLHDYSSFIRN